MPMQAINFSSHIAYFLSLSLQLDIYMDSEVIAAVSACDLEKYSDDGRGPEVIAADSLCDKEEYSDDGRGPQKQQALRQPIILPSVSVLCSTCAQPRWESGWNFNIEDGVLTNNNSASFKRGGDLMKDREKAGKSQKTRRNMGRVFYHRAPRVLLSP